MRKLTLVLILLTAFSGAWAQLGQTKLSFTHDDSLRGTLNANRSWWDVLRYDLEVTPDFNSKSIRGRNTIKFSGNTGGLMQIDLQQPLVIDSVIFHNQHLPFTRYHNTCLVELKTASGKLKLSNADHFITIYYHGTPVEAVRAPWDGGWIFTKDKMGRPWMSVACQGLGASVWYPCKDHQSDEPNEGASLTMIVPDSLVAVANGRLISKIDLKNSSMYRWEVRNPINSYNLIPYIGKYENFGETFNGEDGKLNCQYWVLDYNLHKAREQFKQVKPMLQCFEFWFGPYPFYEDDYKLIESPHLGMEHQSGIAYGNNYINGYKGRDLSGTGWGNLWDFIIIHESGHEWFGNNITSKDIADMWIHESFTNYSETLFTQCQSGLQAGREYIQGNRKNILNDRAIIGHYGVNHEGSGDMYYKGANMLHTIRTIINNDSLFRNILRGLNKDFYHATVTTAQIENYISAKAGIDCRKIFDQYLRTTQIPVVEWKINKGRLSARLSNCVKGLSMPMPVPTEIHKTVWKTISEGQWTTLPTKLTEAQSEQRWNKNYYVEYKAVNP